MKQYIGVDVGKSELDVFDGNTHSKYKNTTQDISLFAKEIKNTYPSDIIVTYEATGGYEQELSEILAKEKVTFKRIHPNKIRNFGKALGYLAKTDKIDAQLIWKYSTTIQPEEANHLLSEDVSKLKALIGRREQLTDDKVREKNRLDKLIIPAAKESIKKHIEWIEKELKEIESQIKKHIKDNNTLKVKVKLYQSIKGIGLLSAAYLISYMPELGSIEHNDAASLAGLAPMNSDSGKKKGKRSIQAGRASIRKVLYMAALTAASHNTDLKEFFQRLMSRGKLFKVAITAVMRKLIILANCVAKRGTPWEAKLC